jgi:hypothetical protein
VSEAVPAQLDERETHAAAAHLNYELKMMGALYAWTCRFDAIGPALMKNACLEATLIHIRLLIEFLAGRHRPTKSDPFRRWWSPKDVSPAHFVTGWTGFRDKRFDGYLELTDQYVAHLSIVRAQTIAGQAWSLEHMVDGVLLEFANFVDAVERAGRPAVDVLPTELRALSGSFWRRSSSAEGSTPVTRAIKVRGASRPNIGLEARALRFDPDAALNILMQTEATDK